jgi:hypothetical protein
MKTRFDKGEAEYIGDICKITRNGGGCYSLWCHDRLIDSFKTLDYARQTAQKILNAAREREAQYIK